MSARAAGWAKKQRAGCTEAKAVLLLLADYADSTGVATPSTRTLAEDAETSQTSIRRHLAVLRERGLVSWDGGSGRQRNRYLLALEGSPLVSHPDGSQEAPVVSHPDGSQEGGSQTRSEPFSDRSEPFSDRSEPGRASDQPKRRPNKREQEITKSAAREAPADAATHTARAAEIINGHLGARPRPIKLALTKIVAEYLADGIPDTHVIAGLTLWDTKGYSPTSLASFVSEAQTRARTPDTRSVWDKPPDQITDTDLTVDVVNEILGETTLPPPPPDVEALPWPDRKRWMVAQATTALNQRRIKARTLLADHWTRARAS